MRAKFDENRPTFDEPMAEVQLEISVDKCTNVGGLISRSLRKEIEKSVEKQYKFMWVECFVHAMNRLRLYIPQAKPISQRKRKLRDKRRLMADHEVNQVLSENPRKP